MLMIWHESNYEWNMKQAGSQEQEVSHFRADGIIWRGKHCEQKEWHMLAGVITSSEQTELLRICD